MSTTKSPLMRAIQQGGPVASPQDLAIRESSSLEMQQAEDATQKSKRPRARTKAQQAPQENQPAKEQQEQSQAPPQQGDILYLNDPASAYRTVLMMKTLTFFLIQEGYDFEIPKP